MAGLGPFVIGEYVPGQHMTFTRNPHYWRKDAAGVALPYLDRSTWSSCKSQDAEMLRMQAGTLDLMTQADVSPEDIASLRRLRDQGAVQLAEPGVGVDPIMLWFNLTPAAAAQGPKTKPYLPRAEFRQAICLRGRSRRASPTRSISARRCRSTGRSRPATAPGIRTPRRSIRTIPARAKALLAGLGLTDRNGDGMLEDAAGQPVRFSILTQGGAHPRPDRRDACRSSCARPASRWTSSSSIRRRSSGASARATTTASASASRRARSTRR